MSNTTGAPMGGPSAPQGAPVATQGAPGLRRDDLILIALTGLLTIAIAYVCWQISKVSDLASEIHNTNGRIDQIYPLIAGAAGDIGSIKGTLEVSSQRIAAAAEKATAAADRAESLSKTLTELAKAQSEQIRSVHEVTGALAGPIRETKSQQDQIDNIDKYIRSLPPSKPIRKTEFLSGAYVYTFMKNGKDIE